MSTYFQVDKSISKRLCTTLGKSTLQHYKLSKGSNLRIFPLNVHLQIPSYFMTPYFRSILTFCKQEYTQSITSLISIRENGNFFLHYNFECVISLHFHPITILLFLLFEPTVHFCEHPLFKYMIVLREFVLSEFLFFHFLTGF